MATATPLRIPLSEYLHTSYRPDCDYVVVDPAARKGFDCSGGEWIQTTRFAVPGSPIHVDLAALFAAIDEDRAR